MSLRSLLSTSPTIVSAVRSLKRLTDGIPWSTQFWDGERRSTTLGVARLFTLWRAEAERIAESEVAYAVYDGGDFLDVGAFHGWYAALLAPKARAGSTMVLVEPDPAAIGPLRRTCSELTRLFPAVRFEVEVSAAGSGAPVSVAYLDGPIGHPRFAETPAADGPPGRTLDEIVLEMSIRPSLLKVDVEGAEAAVLRGAAQTLRSAGPTVILETHPLWQPRGVSVWDAEQPLREAGYEDEPLNETRFSVRAIWSRPR